MVYQKMSGRIGALGSVKMKYVNPLEPLRKQYPNAFSCDQLVGKTLTYEDYQHVTNNGSGGTKNIYICQHDNFPGVEFIATQLHFHVEFAHLNPNDITASKHPSRILVLALPPFPPDLEDLSLNGLFQLHDTSNLPVQPCAKLLHKEDVDALIMKTIKCPKCSCLLCW
jgi:hypothetical protein